MNLVFDTGRCCEGDRCNHPERELRPTHKCPKCERTVHQQCGIFNKTLDNIVCNTCTKINIIHKGSELSSTREDVNSLTNNNEWNTNDILDIVVRVKPMYE